MCIAAKKHAMLIKLEVCRNYSQRNNDNDIKQLVPSAIMLLVTVQFSDS